MRYKEFKALIHIELLKHPDGLTWRELKDKLNLPYKRPCQTWIKQLEGEIGLSRVKGTQRAYIWKVTPIK
jgi:hypothetical protein